MLLAMSVDVELGVEGTRGRVTAEAAARGICRELGTPAQKQVALACGFVGLFSRFFFFFQAEDGIRDRDVTGVQTCALPIWKRSSLSGSPNRIRNLERRTLHALRRAAERRTLPQGHSTRLPTRRPHFHDGRSEERRVGKECRSRGAPHHNKRKKSNFMTAAYE